MEGVKGLKCLGSIGGSAVPALIEIYNEHLSDTDPSLRVVVVETLGYIHVTPDVSIPALTNALHDPVGDVRYMSAISLGAFGSDAKSAVPDLTKALADTSGAVRDEAASALKKIDPEAAANAGVK